MLDQTIDGVRIVTLRREPMNTLDLAAVEALGALFAEHRADVPLVLAGSGGVFCAGVDAKAFMGYAPAQRLEMAQAITQMTAHLLAIAAPVVAAIPGHALGGGLVLALCCDHRVATDAADAKFGLFEAKAGIAFPSGPALIVQRALPAPLLRQLTLSCRSVSAQELAPRRVRRAGGDGSRARPRAPSRQGAGAVPRLSRGEDADARRSGRAGAGPGRSRAGSRVRVRRGGADAPMPPRRNSSAAGQIGHAAASSPPAAACAPFRAGASRASVVPLRNRLRRAGGRASSDGVPPLSLSASACRRRAALPEGRNRA